jgi:hypothetical protein
MQVQMADKLCLVVKRVLCSCFIHPFERWIVRTSLSVNVFVTLATQEHLENLLKHPVLNSIKPGREYALPGAAI